MRTISRFIEDRGKQASIYLIICRIGRSVFLYVGHTEAPLAAYVERKRAYLKGLPSIRQALGRGAARLETTIFLLESCVGAREIQAAERWWIRELRQLFRNVINGNSGGRMVVGKWRMQLGPDQVYTFRDLSNHVGNYQRLTCQRLQRLIEECGMSLRYALRAQGRQVPRLRRRGAALVRERAIELVSRRGILQAEWRNGQLLMRHGGGAMLLRGIPRWLWLSTRDVKTKSSLRSW